jgi:hypothetical protein
MRLNGLPLKERIRLQSRRNAKTGCIEWVGQHGRGANKGDGYGGVTVDGKWISAHRAAWIAFVGPIPEGQCVLHKCDNRVCVNPKHLYLGDKRRNRADFMERHPQARALVERAAKLAQQGCKNFWASMSEQERASFSKRRAEAQFGTLTAEERAAYTKKARQASLTARKKRNLASGGRNGNASF